LFINIGNVKKNVGYCLKRLRKIQNARSSNKQDNSFISRPGVSNNKRADDDDMIRQVAAPWNALRLYSILQPGRGCRVCTACFLFVIKNTN